MNAKGVPVQGAFCSRRERPVCERSDSPVPCSDWDDCCFVSCDCCSCFFEVLSFFVFVIVFLTSTLKWGPPSGPTPDPLSAPRPLIAHDSAPNQQPDAQPTPPRTDLPT